MKLLKRGADNYWLKLAIEIICFLISSQIAPLYILFLILLWWWDLQPKDVINFFAALPLIAGGVKIIKYIIEYFI